MVIRLTLVGMANTEVKSLFLNLIFSIIFFHGAMHDTPLKSKHDYVELVVSTKSIPFEKFWDMLSLWSQQCDTCAFIRLKRYLL